MPRPLFSALIVGFWLCATASLFWFETVRPLLRSDDPPPYAIDLVDEAQRGPQEIHWTVRHIRRVGGKEQVDNYRAVTSIRHHPQDDTFEMRVRLTRPLGNDSSEDGNQVPQLKRLESVQFVTREGVLRRVEFFLVLGPFEAVFKGEVRDGKFYGHYSVGLGGQPGLERDTEPVPVSATGSVLTPLHPVKRIRNIHPDQRWSLPQVDPLRDVMRAEAARYGVSNVVRNDPQPLLDAVVLPEAQNLRWNGHDLPCWVIEYREKGELRARTWVEATSGLVLRQEAIHDGETWEFQRDTGID
jgi:hypothetical protein